MNHSLKDTLGGQVALITGAGSGIGKATAKALSYAGAAVAVLGRTESELHQAAEEIRAGGGRVLEIVADVGDAASMREAVTRIEKEYGRLDIVVANAGINGIRAPIEKIEPEEWDEVIRINLRGVFLTLKYSVPLLKKQGGSIVIVSSVNGNRLFSDFGSVAYSSTKAAEAAMAKLLAVELGPYKVRVNAVCPGSIDTNIDDSKVERDVESIEIKVDYPDGNIPLTGERSGTSGQVAQLIWFLSSGYANHVTGTEVFIDGAQSLLEG